MLWVSTSQNSQDNQASWLNRQPWGDCCPLVDVWRPMALSFLAVVCKQYTSCRSVSAVTVVALVELVCLWNGHFPDGGGEWVWWLWHYSLMSWWCLPASASSGSPLLRVALKTCTAHCSFLLALTQYIVSLCAGKGMGKWSHKHLYFCKSQQSPPPIACLLVSHFNSARESIASLKFFFPVCAKSLLPRGYTFLKLFTVYSCVLLNKRDVCFLFAYLENTEIRSTYIFRAPGCYISRQIWVNFSGWWFWAILIWWALTMAVRQVSQNSRPIVPGFPRPSSRERCWIACALFRGAAEKTKGCV